LQIFLIGQENLRDLIQKPSMEQVHQRLVAACHLDSLSEPDTKAYIRHRLERVGWRDDPTIDEGVYPLVFQFSKGIPRRINLICSRFLLHGCVEEKHRIRAADVRTVVEELQLEQLTPAGFEAELPSLMDDEELDLQPGADNNPPTAPLIERTEPDVAVADRVARETSVVTTPPSPLSRPQPRDDEIPHFCSLEEQTKRKGSHSPDQTASPEEDVIQENYFSLADALDLPSEPIPIRQPVESLVVEQGYGDRFAKAQREKMTADPRTHYYNEYQARAHPRGAPGQKRSLLGITLLFMLILVAASITLYVLRPPLFQDSIERLEQKIGDAISSWSEQAALTPNWKSADTNSNNNTTKDTEATDLVTQDEAAQPAERVRETAPPLPGGPPGSQTERDTPRNDRAVDEQKKTAPVGELSAVSATSAIIETAQHTDNSTPPNLNPVVETPAPIIPVALAPAETGQAVPELPIPITQTAARIVEAETEEPVMAATPTAGDPLPMVSASPAPADEPATPVTMNSIVDEASINGWMSQETVPTSYPPPKRKDTPHTPASDRVLSNERARETARLPTEQASGQRPERQVLFNSNSTAIGEEYVGQLSEVVEWLKRHTEDTARIIGYADNSGNRYYNLELSFKRADAVAAYLEKKNIAKSRLHVEGRGVYPVLRSRSDNGARARHMQRLVKIVIVPPVN
jgi:outer membrane protein OmpA-like peptidoglycan-associated protein